MLNLEDLVGLSYDQAVTLITDAGMKCRVIKADDSLFVVTRDYKRDRVNLTLAGGLVESAKIG